MTTHIQRSQRPSQAENPPLVRVGLNRLLGGVCFVFEPIRGKQRFLTPLILCLLSSLLSDSVSAFTTHWRPKAAESGTRRAATRKHLQDFWGRASKASLV